MKQRDLGKVESKENVQVVNNQEYKTNKSLLPRMSSVDMNISPLDLYNT